MQEADSGKRVPATSGTVSPPLHRDKEFVHTEALTVLLQQMLLEVWLKNKRGSQLGPALFDSTAEQEQVHPPQQPLGAGDIRPKAQLISHRLLSARSPLLSPRLRKGF